MTTRTASHDQAGAPGAGEPATRTSIRSVLWSVAVGVAFFYLVDLLLAQIAGTPLPAWFLAFWSAWPVAGGLLLSAVGSLLSYWVTAAAVALVLASAVRDDFFYYGAIATGAYLVFNLQMNYDGWQAMFEVGADFWLALKLDGLRNDPFGVIGRWFALPVCAWAWGRLLFARQPL